MGEPVAVKLDAQAFAGAAEVADHGQQITRWVGIFAIFPDADVFQDGGVLCLSEIRRAREQRHCAIRAEIEALEEAKTERVIACQPKHALLLEQQHTIKPARLHGVD